MSKQYYMKKWDTAQEDLHYVISCERPPKPEPLPKSLKEAFVRVCQRYVQYIAIYKRLVKCYDYMVHPQKRHLIARCLEGVQGRIVELRYELFRIEINEYAPFGPFCVAYKILPSCLDMELSRTFAREKKERIKRRQDLLEYIFTSMGKYVEVETLPPSTRVTTLTASSAEDDNDDLESHLSQMAMSSRDPMQTLNQRRKNVNWKRVQNQFKIFQNRVALDNIRHATDVFLNMSYTGKNKQEVAEAENKVVSKLMDIAQDNEDVYMERLIMATDSLKGSAAARTMEEDMKQNILQWILECRDATGAFPDYPPEDLGGSAAIFAKKTPEEVQDDLDDPVIEKKAKKEKPKEKKASKKPEPPAGFTMRDSSFVDDVLMDVTIEYETHWKDRDESHNFKQEYCKNLLDEQVNKNVEDLLRQQIDEQMRQELEVLTLAVGKMRMAKAKPKKPKKEKKKKDKKKKLKDLTPNADLEDLYAELVRNDVIKKVPNVFLKDFLGEINLTSAEESTNGECWPDLGDVRKMMFDYVVLPMCNKNVHENAPFFKTLMLVGPTGSGKKMLVNAVCNELGANLFDLTAANIEGKYTDTEGQQMLMHLVMKVGKLLEPSIIFIDDCDLMFTKKLPPEITSNPARMKSNLTKALKTLGPEDRIMLIGATSKPFAAAKAPMLKMYERVVFIPPPSYASRYTLWETMIKSLGGIITRSFVLSVLAHASSNFTAKDIISSCLDVLTTRRINHQNNKPLKTIEFGGALSGFTPVFVEELQAFLDWMRETPLAKKRAEIKELEEAGVNIFDKV